MSMKGTRTEQNLLKAFAGESQARNRYTFYASVAKKEGYDVRRYDKSLELWIRKAREEGGPENVEAISMVARWEKAAGDYRSGDLFGRSEDRAAL